jgi:hypothetical protein
MIQERRRKFQETTEVLLELPALEAIAPGIISPAGVALSPRVSNPSAQPPESGYRGRKTHIVQFRSARERLGNFC